MYGQIIFLKLLQLSWRGLSEEHPTNGCPSHCRAPPPGLCDKTRTIGEMPWHCGASRSRDIAILQAWGQLCGVIET